MKQKRYWLRGGVVGCVTSIIVWLNFSRKNSCIGTYLDHIDPSGTPVIGSVCPKVDIIMNLQQSLYSEILLFVVLFLIGAFIGYLYGKIKSRKQPQP